MTDDLLLLNALADQELDVGATIALEKRLAEEPSLAAAYERIVAAKRAVERLEKPVVSDDFYDRMAALASPEVVPLAARPRSRRRWLAGEWRALAASVLVTACLASGGTYMLIAPSGELAVEDAVVGGHQRSLLASAAVDVVSSDRHTVRPWFDAKLGISPPTPDLAAAGFPLVGGRVDVVGGKTVPTLVYRHDKHLISVVAVPDAPAKETERAPTASIAAGFNVVRWSHGGFSYWAISDLDAPKLADFVNDLVAQ